MKIHRALYYLLLFFLPTQLGLHMWPSWSYVLGRRVDYLSPTIFATDILLVLMIVCWAIEQKKTLLGCIAQSIKTRKKILSAAPYTLLAGALLMALIVINTVYAYNEMAAAYKWIKALEFFLFFYYIKITKPPFVISSFVLLLTITYTSVLALAQFFYQHSIGGAIWFLGERTFNIHTPGIARFDWCSLPVSLCRPILRPYATFPHPNVLAGYIAALLVPTIYLLQTKITRMARARERIGRLVIAATIVLSTITLALTFSRSGLIVGFMVVLLALIVHIAKTKKTRAVLCALIVCFSGALVVAGKQLSVSSESILLRRELNRGAVALWKSSPFFGVGLGNATVGLPGVTRVKQVYFLQPTHNIYLLVLAETGAMGALFFLWIIIRICSRLRNQHTQKNRVIVLVKTLSFASILLVGLVDHYPLTLQQGQLLFVYVIGISYIES